MKTLRTAPALAATVAATALGLAAPLAANAATAHAGQTGQADRHVPVSGHTRVIGDCTHRSVTPHRLVSACADLDTYLVVTEWGYWHPKKAIGEGRLVVNDCTPDCASGTFHRYPATFRLFDVKHTKHGRVFAKLGVTYVRGGEQHDTTLDLPTRPL